jgi:hypothetical protein
MLDLIAEGFKASKLRSRQLAASRSNFSTSANSNTGIPALEAIEDRSFSTWMEWHYRWALTRCQMRVDEDFVCLLTMGTILGTQFLLDE